MASAAHEHVNNLVGRMHRVSLGILIYLIREKRNKKVFDNSCIPVSLVFHRFQILFYMVLHFHEYFFFSGWLFLFVGAAGVSFAAGDGFSRMGLQYWLDVLLLLVVAVWYVFLLAC